MDSLTAPQRAILDLEAQRFDTVGGKEAAIYAMGLTPTRYYQRLVQLLDVEAAEAADPVLIHRLRRIAGSR